MLRDPEPGERYRHWKTGDEYEVICVAREEANPSRQHVIYRAKDGTKWTRPLTSWHTRPDHRRPELLRFTKVDL